MSALTLKPRVLIVEDNPDDGELLMRQIKKAQLAEQVKVIRDGLQAMDFLVQANSPTNDLVAMFLDLKLPSLSGLDLLKRVRADERMRKLPVIVMTSSNSPGDLKECRDLGVWSYVQKPVTFTAFTKAIADTFHNTDLLRPEKPR